MSSESMRGHESGRPVSKLDKEQSRKKEKEDAAKREVAMFREVFGHPSARSEAQRYVRDWLDHEGYENRSLMLPRCDTNEMYGRIGVRELYLVMKDLADRPIDRKPKRPAEIDKSGFNVNTE